MSNVFSVRYFLNNKNWHILFLVFFLFFSNNLCASDGTYANCYTTEVDLIASDDYKAYKNRVSADGDRTVAGLNSTYINFIQLETDTTSKHLFVLLKNDSSFDTNFLSCDFESSEVFKCEADRLWGGKNCTKEISETDEDNITTTTEITTCNLYDTQNIKYSNDDKKEELKSCYPENHICNKYKEDIQNMYFSISDKYVDSSNSGDYFYIYKKNIVKEDSGSLVKNCEFEVFSCDLQIKNESTTTDYVNVVYSDTSNTNNLKFVSNIFSGYDISKRFFDYVGTITKQSANYDEIMEAPYYYKYVNDTYANFNSNTEIYYYTKHLKNSGGFEPKGNICDGYLPNCKYLDPNNYLTALYNNTESTDDGNNSSGRNVFYSDYKDVVREENLWFVNNNNFVNNYCLSINNDSDDELNYDIGYCSDLNDDNTDLKYSSGLNYDFDTEKPNCYLKSCIDLTAEELAMIVNKDSTGSNKYCSEYYWLENDKGFKYFAKESPKYCSDLDSSNELEFREGLYEYNTDENTTDQISYGGGRNSTKSNCYLKNCFSLSDKERTVVANANITNVGFEMEKNFDTISNYSRDNLPKYCDNGFLFTKDFDEFKDFDYLNLNVIACHDFSDSQLNSIKSASSRIVVFTDLIKEYDSNLSKVFCRSHYIPLNRVSTHDTNSNFLEETFIIANEQDLVATNDKYRDALSSNIDLSYNDYNATNFNEIPFNLTVRDQSDYSKIYFSDIKSSGDANFSNYSNVCSYVDNSFLFYNADAWSLQYYTLTSTNSNPKVSSVITALENGKAGAYKNCRDNGSSKNIYSDDAPEECKACTSNSDMDSCLYNTSGCKEYAYDYMCKVEKGCIDKDTGTILNKYCYLQEELAKKYIFDCSQYKTTDVPTNYFDCSLFVGTTDYEKDIYSNYLFSQTDIDGIKSSCDTFLPLLDTRSLPDPDPLYSLVKPYKLTSTNNNASASKTYGTNDVGRYGCSSYDTPAPVTDVLNSSLWGCKSPTDDSSYISTASNFNSMIGKVSDTYSTKPTLSVCSRYPQNIYSSSSCGQRQGSSYQDRCISLNTENHGSTITLEDTTDGTWYFKNGTGGTRFRSEAHVRDILIFRDFYTYYKCSSSNDNSPYYDSESMWLIYAELFAICWIAIGGYTGVIGAGICAGIALLTRTKEYNLSLQNDMNYPHEYYGNIDNYGQSGFLTRANITNNDNYIYRYYKRADYIEDDIKSKLESNIDYADGTRFFYGNTLSKDIIRNCKIYNLFGITGPCVTEEQECRTIVTLAKEAKDAESDESMTDIEKNQKRIDFCTNYLSVVEYDPDSSFTETSVDDDNNIVDECKSYCLTYRTYFAEHYARETDSYNSSKDYSKLENFPGFCYLDAYIGIDNLKTLYNTVKYDVIEDVGDIADYYFDYDDYEEYDISSLINTNSAKTTDSCKSIRDDCEYDYSFFYLNDDGSRQQDSGSDKECEPGESQTAELCLQQSHIDCLGGYGVKFLFNSGINEEFITTDGSFLKTYKDGDSVKEDYGTNSENEFDWLPLRIVPLTQDLSDKSTLKSRTACSLKKYGDAYGTLEECRGFSDTQNKVTTFYTESQSVKIPLFSSPVFFYTLITPRNIPELFNPTLSLSYFYLFSKYSNGTIADSNRNEYTDPNEVILDFYNPRLQYSYEFANGVSDSDYENLLSVSNEFISEIFKNKQYSYAYQVKYKSNNLTEMLDYKFVLAKTFSTNLYNAYTPKVCLHKIALSSSDDSLNAVIDADVCSTDGCLSKTSSQSFIIIDNDIECYERSIPYLNNFVFSQSSNIEYNNPVINAYLKPTYLDLSDVTGNESIYALKQNDSKDITTNGENEIQSFGLNFERSYCSKVYYDYYYYLNLLEIESNKTEGKDLSKISLYKKNISSIESTVITDCREENGNEVELLINESELSPLKDAGSVDNVISKEIVKIRQNNELYGGFNEVCLADKDISNILSLYNSQNSSNISLPSVLVYKDLNLTQRTTKCVLDDSSRNKSECLTASEVYIYCNQEEIGINLNCKEKFDITNNQMVYVKSINCEDYLGKSITEDNISEIQACFKGGFNMLGNIYKQSECENGECKPTTKEYACSCQVVTSSSNYNESLYSERTITSREYGLCVDLVEPNICPSVKYYDSSNKYVDDNLALGKTLEELKSYPAEYYEQHEWRTNEKQLGILPAVFYSSSLGNAEFSSSVYCSADIEGSDGSDCIGGTKYIEGECNGYWKESSLSAPKAICTAKTTSSGTTIYEYQLTSFPCERYICSSIGYEESTNRPILNEQDIETNDPNLFTSSELNRFSAITITDFTSFINNEELDSSSIDIRGVSNGFSIWGEIGSSDYAEIVTSNNCLTGFGPSGSNYLLNNELKIKDITSYSGNDCTYSNNQSNYDNYNVDYNNMTVDDYNKIIELYKDRQCDYNNILTEKGYNDDYNNYPQRRCNQLGEWMTVDDLYNLSSISSVYESNYYYNNDNNFWVLAYLNNYITIETLPNITTTQRFGYCERLICNSISSNNNNYYTTEFLNSDEKAEKNTDKYRDQYTVWNHSGGALWDRVSAPRNSSNSLLGQDEVAGYSNTSKKINEIFNVSPSNDIESSPINNKYKYVKKVYGVCENNYGYYNRGSSFIGDGNFLTHLNYFSEIDSKVNSDSKVDPRSESLLDSSSEITKPFRHCTSIGLWGGVYNSCFRGCEMMNIYNTEFNEELYSNDNNLIKSDSYFVENNDIKTINTNMNLTAEEKEGQFVLLNLSSLSTDKTAAGFTVADYLTGGASWARSIVSNDIGSYSIETSGDKKSMRYIEVESDCDSSFETANNEVRQFIAVSIDKKPTRKCYEDGSWGPVFEDTRCVLSKNCIDFSFTLRDLTELIYMYNNNISSLEINSYVADLAYGVPTTSVIGLSDNLNTNIYSFTGSNTTLESSVSYNSINTLKSYAFVTTKTNEEIIGCNTSSSSTNCKYAGICNLSESNEQASVSGWSLNLVSDDGTTLNGSRDIGRYFEPTTCNISKTTDGNYDEGLSILNRLVFVYDPSDYSTSSYSKDSGLNYSYDNLNSFTKSYYSGTSVENDSFKKINIGESKYDSYQLHYNCDNRYFYNELKDGLTELSVDSNYINKDIIFECKKNDDVIKFFYNDDSNFIKASDCLAKTCGTNNIYQDSGWSKATIDEVYSKYFGSISTDIEPNTSTSKLECGIENNIQKAFILDINADYDEDKVIYYTDDNDKTYNGEKFATTIKNTCTADNKTSGFINGESVGSDKYGYQKFGEISVDGLPRRFCKDLTRTDCMNVDISEDDLFRSSTSFKENYCVKLSCPGANLELNQDEGTISSNASGSNVFSLPESDYKFGDVVAIQSFDGDYYDGIGTYEYTIVTGRVCSTSWPFSCNITTETVTAVDPGYKINGSSPNYTYVQYSGEGGTAISGKLCSTGYDIYNTGGKVSFDFSYYIDTKTDSDEINNIYSCFSNLEDYESISGIYLSEYAEVESGTYVKYSDNYEDYNYLTSFESLKTAIESYSLTDDKKTAIKQKAAEFIVNNVLFDGIEPNYTKIEEESTINKSLVNAIINNAESTARVNTENYISSSDNNFSFICKNDGDENFEIITDTNDKIIEFEEISNKSSYDFYSYSSNNKDYIVYYFDIAPDGSDCATTKTEYVISSSVKGYYMIKDEEPLCVDLSDFAEGSGTIVIDGIQYTKTSTDCSYKDESDEDIAAVKVNKSIPEGKCFYSYSNEEDSSTLVASSLLTATNANINCGDIDETTCNSATNNPINSNSDNAIISSIGNEVSYGEFTWVASESKTCEDSYYFTKNEINVNGSRMVSIDDYIDTYNEKYQEAVNTAKTALITEIINGNSSYTEIFEKYYSIFNIKNFLSVDTNNDLFTEYYKYKNDVNGTDNTAAQDIVINIIGEEDIDDIAGITEKNIGVSYSEYMSYDDESNNKTVYYSYDIFNGAKCYEIRDSDVSEDGTVTQTTISCDETTINSLKSIFNDIFVNDITNHKDNTEDNYDLTDLITSLNTNITTCNSVFTSYISAMNTYNNTKSEANYVNGLFMVMKCTVDGWKLMDTAACKPRCSGTSNITNIDPTGTGNWNVKMTVSGLRYTKTARAYFAGHANQSCVKSNYVSHGELEIKCTDDDKTKHTTKIVNTTVSSDTGGIKGWDRWYDFPTYICNGDTSFYGDGTSNYCRDHKWQQSGSNSKEDIFSCLPPNSTKKENEDDGDYTGTFGPDGISTIRYIIDRP